MGPPMSSDIGGFFSKGKSETLLFSFEKNKKRKKFESRKAQEVDYMADNWNSIPLWLAEDGTDFLEHDSGMKIEGFEDAIKTGQNIHNVKKALANYQSALKGKFDKVHITKNSDGGATIVFRPTDNSIKISDEDCPSLEISRSKNGFVIRNGMPAANNPVLVRGSNGQIGFASALSVGIDQAAKAVREYMAGWERRNLNTQQLAKKVKITTQKARENIGRLNPALWSPNQVKDFNDSLNREVSIKNLALEGQEVLKSQLLTSFYAASLYNEYKGKKGGKANAPRDEKDFSRQLQDIIDASRGPGATPASIARYIAGHHPWIYQNMWKGELENFFKMFAGHITQGGKKEGAPGIVSLKGPSITFGDFQNEGRKPQQNYRYLSQDIGKFKHRAGQTRVHTKEQLALRGGNYDKTKKALYYAAEATDEDIFNAYKTLSAQYKQKIADASVKNDKVEVARLKKKLKDMSLAAMKGFGKDGSFMLDEAMEDFAGMHVDKMSNAEISEAKVNEIILKELTKKLTKQKGNSKKAESEIAALANQEFEKLQKNDKGYRRATKDALHRILKLDNLDKVSDYTKKDGKYSGITITQDLDNHAMKVVGGGTSDFRSSMSSMQKELFEQVLLQAGYKKKDIYDSNGNLQISVLRQKEALNEKNIRSAISRAAEYVFNHKHDFKTSSNPEEDEFKQALKAVGLQGCFEYDEKNQIVKTNEEALRKKFFNYSERRDAQHTPFGLLNAIIKLGQNFGIYDESDGYKVKNGKSFINDPRRVDAMEIQVFSGDRYESLGDDTSSGMKWSWRELGSIRGTIADMESKGGEIAKAAEPVRKLYEKVSRKMAEKDATYKNIYKKNVGFLSETFSKDSLKTREELSRNEAVKLLTLEEIANLSTDLDGYIQKEGETGIDFDQNMRDASGREFSESFLKRARQVYYDSLVKKYNGVDGYRGDGARYLKEKLGIGSADEIQLGIDLGGRIIGHKDEDGILRTSGVVMLGRGDVTQGEMSGLYMPDEIAGHNARIIRSLQEWSQYTGANPKEAGSRASRKIFESTGEMASAIEQGKIYEKYHKLEGDDSSGYLLLTGLNEHASEIFGNLFGDKENAPSMMISAHDARSFYDRLWKESGGRQQILDQYKELMGKEAGKMGKEKIIDAIINAADISNENYAGKTISNLGFNRSPTINFLNDTLGGRMVISSDEGLVGRGSMAINKNLAAAVHGDMDGDRVALFNAFVTGDIPGARKALESYYAHLQDNQKKILDEKDEFDIAKINSVADIAKRTQKAVGQNISAKGAGLYGNLLFGIEGILEAQGLSSGEKALNPADTFAAKITEKIAHTLYQEGINPKNMKGFGEGMSEEDINALMAERSNELMSLARMAETWNTYEGMTVFLDKAEDLGILKADKVFKPELIADLGFQDLGKESPELSILIDIAERTLENLKSTYGKDSDQVKRLKKDYDKLTRIKNGGQNEIKNLSKEFLAAIATDKKSGLSGLLASKGFNFGAAIENRLYEFIPGYSREYQEAMSKESFQDYGEAETKEFGENINWKDKKDQSYYRKLKEASLAEYHTSPSKKLHEYAAEGYGASDDGRELDKFYEEGNFDAIAEWRSARGYEKFKSVLERMLHGAIAHKAAEVSDGMEGAGFDKAAYKEEIVERLKKMGIDAKDADEFFEKNWQSGVAQIGFINNKIRDENGTVFGKEIPLAGFTGNLENGEADLSHQTADLIYVTTDKNGKKTFHIVDHKFKAGGKVNAANILQQKEYAESLKTLEKDILESGMTSGEVYWASGGEDGNNIIAKGWRRRLDAMAEKDLRDQGIKKGDKGYSQALFERRGFYKNYFLSLFDALKTGDNAFVADLFAHDKDGNMVDYSINLYNESLQKAYQEYRDSSASMGDPDWEKMLESISSNPDILSIARAALTRGSLDKKATEQLVGFQGEMVSYAQEKANIDREQVLLDAKRMRGEYDPELEKKIQEDWELLTGGYSKDGSFAGILEHVEDLKTQQRAITDVSPESVIRKTELEKDIKSLVSSKAYQLAAKFEGLRKITAYDGSEIDVKAIAEGIGYNDLGSYDKFYAQGTEQYKEKLAFDTYTEAQDQIRATQKKIYEVQNLLGSKFLSGTDKAALEKNLEILVETLKVLTEGAGEAEEILKKDGKWKEGYEKAGRVEFTEEERKALEEKSARHARVSESQKDINFFNMALGAFRSEEKIRKEISDYEELIEKGGSEEDMKIWGANLANKRRELEIQQSLLPDLKDAEGYSEEREKEAREMAKLEASKARRERLRADSKSGNYENGGMSYFGLDGSVMRWVERMMEGGALMTFIAKLKKGLSDIINKAQQLNKSLTNLRVVTGYNASEAETLVGQYADLAKQLGTTTVNVIDAANEWTRQGYNVAEVQDLVKSSTYLSKLGMLDATTAVKDLTSALKGFKLGANEAMGVVDKLTALDVEAATSAGEIAEGLAKFANLASLNGVDMDQASAYVATIADVTQQSGTSVGQAMKTIMSRFGNVKATAYNNMNIDNDSEDAEGSLNDVEKVLNKLGISIRDSNLEFRDFDEVLDLVADKWGSLDSVSKKAISTAFAGVRQQESFVTLMENYDKYRDLLETSRNSSGTAEKKYLSYQESYEAARNRRSAALEDIANDSSIINVLTKLTDMVTKIIEIAGRFLKYIPSIAAGMEGLNALQGKGVFTSMQKALDKIWKGGDSMNGRFSFKGLKANLIERKESLEKAGDYLGERLSNSRFEWVRTLGGKLRLEQAHDSLPEAKDTSSPTKNIQIPQSQPNDDSARYFEAAGRVQALKDEAKNFGSVKYSPEAEKYLANLAEKQALKKKGGMMVASMAAAGIAAAATQLATAATNHKVTRRNAQGEKITSTVDSSEGAQQTGSAFAAVGNLASGIPIIGPLIGMFSTKIGEWISQGIDADRDRANVLTELANENISALENIESGIDSIGEDVGSLASQDAVSEFMKELYSDEDDSKNARALLEQYIKPYLTELGADNLYDVLMDIKDGNEDAYRALQLAQIQAEKDQVANKYSSQMYSAQEDVNEAYSDYNSEVDRKSTAAGVGAGLGTASAGFAVTMGIVAALGAIGSIFTGGASAVLAAAATAAAAAGAGLSIYGGVKTSEAVKKNTGGELTKKEWGAKTPSEKIDEVQATLQEAIKSGDTELVDKCNTLIDALQKQVSLSNQMLAEMDDLTLEAALVAATVEYKNANGEIEQKALSDMSIMQLRNIGKDEILLAYAQAIESQGGLLNENVWGDDAHTALSDSGYTYLTNKLKGLDDEEINAVLNGTSYTLSEALQMRRDKGETKESTDLLNSFASALNVNSSDLAELEGKYGALTLSEILMSTSELQERVGGFTDLLSEIGEGAGDVSAWMGTLIQQFPELIAYMGDTSTLFSKMGEKLAQLSETYLQSQYADVTDSDQFYSTIKDAFYGRLSGEDQNILDEVNITKASDLKAWLQAQYGSNGELSEQGKRVLEAFTATADEYGTTITSSILKEYYDLLIDFKESALDNEINNLTEQKEVLQQINSEREYENKLIEAKLKLEDASKEKKRVYRAGVGWVYESDQNAILEAQENLESVKNEKTVSSLEEQITELQQEKEKLSSLYDQQNYETLKKLYDSFVGQQETDGKNASTVNGFLQSLKDGINGISKTLSDMFDQDVETSGEEKTNALTKAKEAWDALQNTEKGTSAYNTALTNFHTSMDAAKNAGAKEEDVSGWGGSITDNHNNSLNAWETSEGDLNEQKTAIEQVVLLKDPNNSKKKFVGQVSMSDYQYDSTVLWDILDGIRQKNGIVWAPGSNGKARVLYAKSNGWDARYAPKDADGDDFLTYANRLKTDEGISEAIFEEHYGAKNNAVYYKDGVLYKISGIDSSGKVQQSTGLYHTAMEDTDQEQWVNKVNQKAAGGSLGLTGYGNTLINELGTEAIVTPSGTVTALPSHTGVVPADVTRNLWALGEVAPAISRLLTAHLIPDTLQSNSLNSSTDESVNISTMNITMNPDGSFDADEFVKALRSRVALTKNSSR